MNIQEKNKSISEQINALKDHQLEILMKTTGALINQQKCIDSLYLRIEELEKRLKQVDKTNIISI